MYYSAEDNGHLPYNFYIIILGTKRKYDNFNHAVSDKHLYIFSLLGESTTYFTLL